MVSRQTALAVETKTQNAIRSSPLGKVRNGHRTRVEQLGGLVGLSITRRSSVQIWPPATNYLYSWQANAWRWRRRQQGTTALSLVVATGQFGRGWSSSVACRAHNPAGRRFKSGPSTNYLCPWSNAWRWKRRQQGTTAQSLVVAPTIRTRGWSSSGSSSSAHKPEGRRFKSGPATNYLYSWLGECPAVETKTARDNCSASSGAGGNGQFRTRGGAVGGRRAP